MARRRRWRWSPAVRFSPPRSPLGWSEGSGDLQRSREERRSEGGKPSRRFKHVWLAIESIEPGRCFGESLSMRFLNIVEFLSPNALVFFRSGTVTFPVWPVWPALPLQPIRCLSPRSKVDVTILGAMEADGSSEELRWKLQEIFWKTKNLKDPSWWKLL